MKFKLAYFLVIIQIIPFSILFSEEVETPINKFGNLFYSKKFKEASIFAKEHIKSNPNDVIGYVWIDLICNTAGNCSDSEKNRNNVLRIWKKYYKSKYEKGNIPIRLRTWGRKFSETDKWAITTTEYYEPEELNEKSPTILNHYKFIVQLKEYPQKIRIFKLEHSNVVEDYYVLTEVSNNGFAQIIPYGSIKPLIFNVTSDLEKYLQNEN